MKRIYIILLCALTCMVCHAQDKRLSINAVIADETIPEEAARNLENKLQHIIVSNGFGSLGYTARFVITAKIDVVQKNVVSSTPARVSEKLSITLMVGDIVENTPYATCKIQATGIGINDNKAYISAFNSVKSDDKHILQMLDEARTKIIDYYTNRCSEIVTRANTLASTGKYDEAIFHLTSVPNVCTEYFEQCQSQATVIYQQKINDECTTLLEQGKNAWAAEPNENGAVKVAQIIKGISPKAQNYDQVVELRNIIESKLQDDAKRKWDFEMKQYDDNQSYKQSIVEAYQNVGVAWAKRQQARIVNIIRTWWY